MRDCFWNSILLIGIELAVSSAGRAQSTPQKEARPAVPKSQAAPRTPDLTGVWDTQNPRGFQPNTAAFPGEIPPLTPWAEAQLAATRPAYGPRAVPDSTDPVNPTKLGAHGCFPPGVPRIYLHPVPMEIIQIPGRVLMRFEFDHLLREIWTDGRGHPSDWNPTYMGHSIGKWQGDTFVVDTIGFNDKTWLDRLGHRHSEDLHVIERFRRVDHVAGRHQHGRSEGVHETVEYVRNLRIAPRLGNSGACLRRQCEFRREPSDAGPEQITVMHFTGIGPVRIGGTRSL